MVLYAFSDSNLQTLSGKHLKQSKQTVWATHFRPVIATVRRTSASLHATLGIEALSSL